MPAASGGDRVLDHCERPRMRQLVALRKEDGGFLQGLGHRGKLPLTVADRLAGEEVAEQVVRERNDT